MSLELKRLMFNHFLNDIFMHYCHAKCSTSLSGGNLVDGLPPALVIRSQDSLAGTWLSVFWWKLTFEIVI